MATIQTVTDWKKEWFEIEDATYLNTAAHAAMPRVSLRAVQASLEAKRFPHHVDDSAFFEVPNRLRALNRQTHWGQAGRDRADDGRKHWRRGRGTWPDVEAGRRDHHCQGRVPAAVRHLEANGRTRGRETENRGAAGPLYYGGRSDCRDDAENARHLRKSCAL